MADWEAALDKQAATWVWWNGESAHRVAAEWVRDVNEKYGSHETADRMVADQRRLLWWADPIYVTREMGHLLQSAWETFEPEPLREDDLIVPAGFALLPFPFYIDDVWGKKTAVRAIAWQLGAWDTDKGGASGVRVSRIRRDPPPKVKEKLVDPKEVERRDTVIGVLAFTFAILVITFALASYNGWTPRQYTLEISSYD